MTDEPRGMNLASSIAIMVLVLFFSVFITTLVGLNLLKLFSKTKLA